MIDVAKLSLIELLRVHAANPNPWRRGLPRGEYYPGMVDDFEVSFAIMGKWHRARPPEQKAAWQELKRRNKAAVS